MASDAMMRKCARKTLIEFIFKFTYAPKTQILSLAYRYL